jgi:enoyl-CoA hydratase
MAEDATIAFPETGLGTFVGGGVTHILPRIVGLSRAKDLIYSGKILNGSEAVKMGVALKCFPVESLLEETMRFALNLAEKAPVSMALAKKYLDASPFSDLQTVLDNETEAIISCMETDDWQEGINAFSEKRKPEYRGR